MASPSDEQKSREEAPTVKEMMHKTKIIQFFGRTTPIILQKDNGPCPLLAICNILSLKNSLNLSPDLAEVSQEKLLSLVAERLIDSNSNVNNKDEGYVKNQQQNISDAIDLLPQLTTGIDVNIKFTGIKDFEFTRECAIFDLLDIPLYHGWIVDPQDSETSNAIGSKSYNTLMGELVALEPENMKSVSNKNLEQDSVENIEKGNLEEENELLRAMKLSNTVGPTSENVDLITFEDEKKSDNIVNQESKDGIEESRLEAGAKTENVTPGLSGSDPSPSVDTLLQNSENEKIVDQSTSSSDVNEVEKIKIGEKILIESESLIGDKCILETNTTTNEDQNSTARQGEVIRNFINSTASQLTIYGLFSLQDGLKDRELCVFFRNNHFNTMFKFEGELYILATDQGYLNQPDLVWEKLNEVNGNTVFVNDNFKEFNAQNQERRTWDERNVMANTADYLARIDNSTQGNTGFSSDMQLAIALQQQEFEQQQQQQQPPRVAPQSPTTSRSGLVVGPQHVHPSRPRQEPKTSKEKEKCVVM
ncbi:hypothetical protein L1887_27508 [Cichorium endivia]|nr:hypothetical protein L1887_27508 [Cichorium endivia]